MNSSLPCGNAPYHVATSFAMCASPGHLQPEPADIPTCRLGFFKPVIILMCYITWFAEKPPPLSAQFPVARLPFLRVANTYLHCNCFVNLHLQIWLWTCAVQVEHACTTLPFYRRSCAAQLAFDPLYDLCNSWTKRCVMFPSMGEGAFKTLTFQMPVPRLLFRTCKAAALQGERVHRRPLNQHGGPLKLLEC